MHLTRTIGRVLVGKVAPWQAGCGAFLGVLAGFTPASAAPGLFLLLVLAALLLNVNLVLLAAAFVLSQVAALLLAPMLFHVGQLVIDGPLSPLIQLLINAPVLAYAGFDSYVAVGGMIFGAGLGGIAATLAASRLTRFRHYLASLDEESPQFREVSARRSFRINSFVLLGGMTRFSEIRNQPRTFALRPLGAVALALALMLGVTFNRALSGPVVAYVVEDIMERFNGATVDLRSAEFHAKEGKLVLHGLAMADPASPGRDLFRAARLEADIGVTDLLRKRFRVDRLAVPAASSGEERRERGLIVGEPPRPAPRVEWPDAKSLEDHLRNAGLWKQRLAQARRWLQQLGAGPDPIGLEAENAVARRHEAEKHGYAEVRAVHLVERVPTLLIAEFAVGDFRIAQIPGENFRLVGRNLSTAPSLVPGPLSLELVAASGRLSANLALAGRNGGANLVEMHWTGLPAEKLAGLIMHEELPVFAGGTIDLHFAGALNPDEATLDLPLEAVLNQSTVLVGGRPLPVERFSVPIVLAGPVDNPAIRLDTHVLGQALAQASAREPLSSDLLDSVIRNEPAKRNN